MKESIKDLLDKMAPLYEVAIREAIQSKTDPQCYTLFIPYYGCGMPADECAKFSCEGEFLGENWIKKSDNTRESKLYTWGEFIYEGDRVQLNSPKLEEYLNTWYEYVHSDEVKEEFDEYETVARKLGDVVAAICLRLNSENLAEDGKKLAADFVVFTDFMEPSGDMPGLGQCVSADWLAMQKSNGKVPDFI